jgi:hypothetical protein
MGEGYGEDNLKGACKARRDHQGKDDGASEAENHCTRRSEKEVVATFRGRARPGHGISAPAIPLTDPARRRRNANH